MELNKKTMRTIFLGVAGCIVLYWLLHETERLMAVLKVAWSILSPFVAGSVIAFILNVPMRAIERKLKFIKKDGARRAVAILLTVIVIIMVLIGVFYLLVPQVLLTAERLVATLPDFFRRTQVWINDYLTEHPELMEWLSENTDFESMDWNSLIQKAVSLVSNSLTLVFDKAFTAVIGLSTGVFNGILSLVFAVYALARKEILARQFRRVLYAFLPERVCDETVRVMRMSNSTFSNFISGQCLEAVILGCMFAICMLIFRMPYIPLVSVIIAVTALVPIVGAFVGCVIGAFFIMVESVTQAFWFVIMFLILQQIEGNLIYPRVVGTSIGLPGMWVLVAVAVGGGLMGIGGMLLMIPLASVLYALAREVTSNRLAARGINRDKLQDHPPELQSKFREKRKKKKEKKLLAQMKAMAEKHGAKHGDNDES